MTYKNKAEALNVLKEHERRARQHRQQRDMENLSPVRWRDYHYAMHAAMDEAARIRALLPTLPE